MLWEGMIHISGIANPHIQDQRIANPLEAIKEHLWKRKYELNDFWTHTLRKPE